MRCNATRGKAAQYGSREVFAAVSLGLREGSLTDGIPEPDALGQFYAGGACDSIGGRVFLLTVDWERYAAHLEGAAFEAFRARGSPGIAWGHLLWQC